MHLPFKKGKKEKHHVHTEVADHPHRERKETYRQVRQDVANRRKGAIGYASYMLGDGEAKKK